MSLWQIAWGYLWNRKLTTLLTILSVGLSVGLITAVLTLREEMRKRFEEEGQAFDLVVGRAGSPLQLVLSSVYFMDDPTGNIPLHAWHDLLADEENVEAAYPISLGDSYQGARLVGTTTELFGHVWVNSFGEERWPFDLAEGRYFEGHFEAVVGASAARRTGLRLGDEFISTHGMIEMPEGFGLEDHSDTPYTVVGILAPSTSPFDHAIYTSLESVWIAHAEHDHPPSEPDAPDGHDHEHEHAHDHALEYAEWEDAMITAVLVQLVSPALRFEYREHIIDTTRWMAAIPIMEIVDLFDTVLETAKNVLLAIGYLVVVISAISIMIGLYLSILQRRRDLAIMRALGASAFEIFGAVIIEAFLVTSLGIISGWFLGNAVSFVLGAILSQQIGLSISTFGLVPDLVTAYATVALVGLAAGILPAWQAYDSDVARDLAER